MESSNSWSIVTASLNYCDLRRPFTAWAFLVLQGLVRDAPGDREVFADYIQNECRHGHTIGASLGYRAALFLMETGLTLPAGKIPDPNGNIALSRLSAIKPWGNPERDSQSRMLSYFEPA